MGNEAQDGRTRLAHLLHSIDPSMCTREVLILIDAMGSEFAGHLEMKIRLELLIIQFEHALRGETNASEERPSEKEALPSNVLPFQKQIESNPDKDWN